MKNTYVSTERPWVWWFWMGNVVTNESIARALQSFHDCGFGGVVIISTYGVKGFEKSGISFQSREWFKEVAFAMEKANELGMGIDLSFASAWPYGGPSVREENAAKKLKGVSTFQSEGGELNTNLLKGHDKDFVIAVAASGQNGVKDLTMAVSSNGVLHTQLPTAKWDIRVLYGTHTRQMVKRSAPGGEGLVLDPFSSEATKSYLSGFEAWSPELKGVRSAFNDSYEIYGADYSPRLLETFQAKRGYSLLPYFHLLFDSTYSEMKERVLCDYRETAAEMLEEGFVSTWINWNRSHHLLSTGQAHGSPGNLLDLYGLADIPQTESFGPSHFTIPGVRTDPDVSRDKAKWPDKLMFKFASSAAHVNGRALCSAETATWLTNHFRLALSQVKPQVDELFVSGVNHTMLISAANTPQSVPFPGWVFYPAPDFGSYSPFYNYLPAFSNYISTCQRYLQQSEPDNDILVYFPIYDYWSELAGDIGVLAGFDHIPTRWGDRFGFSSTVKSLWKNGYSFDYISDKQIKQLTVERGELISSGKTRYKIILIPTCRRMPASTMQAILNLAKQGVKVIFENSIPGDVPGLDTWHTQRNLLKELTSQIMSRPNVSRAGNVVDALQKAGAVRESFQANNLQFIRKNYQKGKLYFVANLDSLFKRGWIELGTTCKSLTIIDPISGKQYHPKRRMSDGRELVDFELLPGQSCFILTNNPGLLAERFPYRSNEDAFTIKTKWNIQFEKNEFMSPASIQSSELKSWTASGDSATRFFCGTAMYSTQFDLPENRQRTGFSLLEIADLRDMAEVVLNGHSLGKLWSVPFSLTFDNRWLRKKNNKLNIRVTNLSANRVIWMEQHHIPWKTFYIADPVKKVFDASDWELQPSGIIGNVRIADTKVE